MKDLLDAITKQMSKKKGSGSITVESVETSDQDEALEDAAQQLIDAVQSGDASKVAKALRLAIEVCSHGEYDEEEDEEDLEDE